NHSFARFVHSRESVRVYCFEPLQSSSWGCTPEGQANARVPMSCLWPLANSVAVSLTAFQTSPISPMSGLLARSGCLRVVEYLAGRSVRKVVDACALVEGAPNVLGDVLCRSRLVRLVAHGFDLLFRRLLFLLVWHRPPPFP